MNDLDNKTSFISDKIIIMDQTYMEHKYLINDMLNMENYN